MQVSRLRKAIKDHEHPQGGIPRKISNFFHRTTPAIRDIKRFAKSLGEDGDRLLTEDEENRLAKILFSDNRKKCPSRNDWSFIEGLKIDLWGFDARAKYEKQQRNASGVTENTINSLGK